MMKEYEGISDEELILRAQNGEKKLEEFLIDKYKGMVRKKAHAMFLIGGEQEDLIQEGMIGLFRAVRDYRPDKNASFATFANLCVERQIYKAIEISGRQMENMELMMPKTLEEQKIIGQFFANLDTLIALHQRKYESLKRVKAALLQKMFV